MIDFKETKQTMDMRGIEFTNAQFSFSLFISIGIDKYDAYKLSMVSDKSNKKNEAKISEIEDKIKYKKSWDWETLASYHSMTPHLNEIYKQKLIKNYIKLTTNK